MTLLARRREELARAQSPLAAAEKTRSVAARPPQPRPSFLHLQAALGNRATSALLRASTATAERRDGPLAGDAASSRDLHDAAADPQLDLVVRLLRTPRPVLLFADGSAAGRGQMSRGAFLVAMREAARAAAEEALRGTGHTARGCPWIEHYFRFYQRQSAERIETDLRRYVPAARGAADVHQLLALAAGHVGASVRHWAATGELAGVPRGLPGAALVRAAAPPTTDAAGRPSPAGVEAELGAGRPLASPVRGRMERVFARRFGAVRLHTDAVAARLARRFGARAFAVGRHVAFDRGEYRPGTAVGDALLAHELAHVAQQSAATSGGASPGAVRAAEPAIERDADTAAAGAVTRLWAGPGRKAAAPAARPRLTVGLRLASCRKKKLAEKIASVEKASVQLTTIAQLVDAAASEVRRLLVTAENRKALQALDQKKVAQWLTETRALYEERTRLIGADLSQQAPLRAAYVKALDAIRKAASIALAAADGLDAATVARERAAYAENIAVWIEASPLTSAGLAAKDKFEQADVEVARAYEGVLAGYLDQLLVDLPKLRLTPAERDRIHGRLLVALRRAYVTVGRGPDERVDVRGITDPAIAEKYRQVTALLVEGRRGPNVELITAAPNITLEEPLDIAKIKADLISNPRIGGIDVTHVPPDEVDYVYNGLRTLGSATTSGVPIVRPNAIWPVTMPVRRGGKVVNVRYELIFDQRSNVRVERLGEERSRVPPSFQRLSVGMKKDELKKEFGLKDVVDRPEFPPRPKREWKSGELDQLKGALDLLPVTEKAILQTVALVRDSEHPPDPSDPTKDPKTVGGVYHSDANPLLDEPGPPSPPGGSPTRPPHIHYYDFAFDTGKFAATGAPGAAGPGIDQTLFHEIGHLREAQRHINATAAVAAAKERIQKASDAISKEFDKLDKRWVLARWSNAYATWNKALEEVTTAISEYSVAVKIFDDQSEAAKKTAKPFPDPATLEPIRATAEAAIQASDTILKGLAKRRVPAAVLTAAAERQAAAVDHLNAVRQELDDHRQIAIFATLAGRFGFHAFTDYARTGGEGEWFAEAYSLWVTDPHRLNALSPKLFQWFEAGQPQDPQWEPPPK